MRPVLIALTCLLAAGIPAATAVPPTISYQAELADDQGVPLTGGHTVDIAIYDMLSGGTQLWTESHAVTADNGLITLELGSTTGLDATVFDGSTRYLEISVDGGSALSPRTPLITVPYAFRSDEATHAATADFATDAAHAAVADSVAGASSGGNGWVMIGDMQDLYDGGGEIPGYPLASYQYGFIHVPILNEVTPFYVLGWNQGLRICAINPTMLGTDDLQGTPPKWGGSMFYIDTNGAEDDGCTSSNWYHRYWYLDVTNGATEISFIGGNGCLAKDIYARLR